LTKDEFGVSVKFVEPEHAVVAVNPWPNSTPDPELSVMLPAKVLWKKKTEATKSAKGAIRLLRNFLDVFPRWGHRDRNHQTRSSPSLSPREEYRGERNPHIVPPVGLEPTLEGAASRECWVNTWY
jgi:hypothetical protein